MCSCQPSIKHSLISSFKDNAATLRLQFCIVLNVSKDSCYNFSPWLLLLLLLIFFKSGLARKRHVTCTVLCCGGGGGGGEHFVCIAYYFHSQCISVSQMGKKKLIESITIFSCQADFTFLLFRRPSFSKFLSVQALTSYTLQFIAASGQPECQPDVHPWATHAHFSQYLVPETPLIPRKSDLECPIYAVKVRRHTPWSCGPLSWITGMFVYALSISFAMAQSSHNSEIYNIGVHAQ